MRVLTLVALLAFVSVCPAQEPQNSQKTVLVTGASTGIGRRITEHLASRGWFVFAGARKQADLDALNRIPNVQAIRLDVTRQEDIDAAAALVGKSGRSLDGLINNAGIATLGPVADTTIEEYELLMSVNVDGPWRMVRTFMPLLVAGKGRIVNIGSISGVLAPRDLPAYSMSKHAIEAFTDSLAQQLEPLGVQVAVVEPGNYDSDIGKSATQRTGQTSRFTDRSMYKKPDEVASAVEQALTEQKAKRRYMVVPNQREAELTIRKQIAQLVQLNEGHAYTYDRDALVKMLDEALANARPRQ
jgi:NAD(P)-dependent dehydrogenase (short-subunit alcohol dehydrogenase family)